MTEKAMKISRWGFSFQAGFSWGVMFLTHRCHNLTQGLLQGAQQQREAERSWGCSLRPGPLPTAASRRAPREPTPGHQGGRQGHRQGPHRANSRGAEGTAAIQPLGATPAPPARREAAGAAKHGRVAAGADAILFPLPQPRSPPEAPRAPPRHAPRARPGVPPAPSRRPRSQAGPGCNGSLLLILLGRRSQWQLRDRVGVQRFGPGTAPESPLHLSQGSRGDAGRWL